MRKFNFNWNSYSMTDAATFYISILQDGLEVYNSARLLGAGLATIALAGVGVGVGYVFGQFVSSIGNNLKEEAKLRQIAMLGFAVTEAIGLFALMIVFLILFGV
jgi:F0F1-type ATP synthase membrane subunit c/vacuolar-type H+-ATPase subunit K